MGRDPRRRARGLTGVRGLFVTGTDTGVGKSVVCAAICARLRAEGQRVAAVKPILTGLDEAIEPGAWPPDHELLGLAADLHPEVVAPLRFGPAVSPHFAAELAGCRIDAEPLLEHAHAAARNADVVVVEGVGGLLVPISDAYSVRDLASDLGLAVVVAARPALGTINHTLLTLEAARTAGLDVRAVVVTPWPEDPTEMERSNRETIARIGDVEVATLPPVARPHPADLAAAARDLPLGRWL